MLVLEIELVFWDNEQIKVKLKNYQEVREEKKRLSSQIIE